MTISDIVYDHKKIELFWQNEWNKRNLFSIKNKGPLDMRMSKKGISAEYVINSFEEDELSKIFWNYGEEHKSRKIAKTIVIERKNNKISTTHDLANLIKKVKLQKKPYRIHPATKIFQALRIFINNELEKLVSSVGQIGEARLLLMTCLIIADKLKDESSLSDRLDHDFLLEALQKITHRVETVADKIN